MFDNSQVLSVSGARLLRPQCDNTPYHDDRVISNKDI